VHPDFGPPPYGIPYIGVSGDQPLEPVTFVLYGSESDAGAPGRPEGYPIPEIAREERIFQAMKTYGLIVADNGSDMLVQGTMDPAWDNDVLNPAFHSLTAADFEVVELGWDP
jgi:hypothetical protein